MGPGTRRGFTLIELLVVITILGVLSAVVVFAVNGINDKGQASACKIDTRTLRIVSPATKLANFFAPIPVIAQTDRIEGFRR